MITQCSYCKRVIAPKTGQWSAQPFILGPGIDISHGICPSCVVDFKLKHDLGQPQSKRLLNPPAVITRNH